MAFVVLSVLLYPWLIALLRQVMFNTVQTDNYAPYLLYLLGDPEGGIPAAPWGYRILSVLAAAPLTQIPTINFSLLQGSSPAYLAATQALAILSYLCTVGTICTAGHIAFSRFHCGPTGTVLAGVLAFVLVHYAAFYSLDVPAILLISLGVLALGSPGWFALLILASTFANEKVFIVFGLVLGVRFLLVPDRRRDHVLLLMPIIVASMAYAFAVNMVALPKLPHQEGPGRFLETIAINVEASLSLRGLLLNILPVLVVATLALLARHGSRANALPYASRPDWLVVPLMLCVALVASVSLNIGRIVMHTFPLFIGPAALALERQFVRQGPRSV